MNIIGLDHLVLNTRDVEAALTFYGDILGLELLRLQEFRQGKVGAVSVRVSPQTVIDIRPGPAGDRNTPNVDHFALVLGPTDMSRLHTELKAKGVRIEAEVRTGWGAQGYGQQFKIWDPRWQRG